MEEIKAPTRVNWNSKKNFIFLAGTIDMGESEDWQHRVTNLFRYDQNVVILNPRREEWDPSWEQTADDAHFYQQVNWEMDCMDGADIIIMNFVAGSKSPITLLELGLYADSEKLLVCCPEKGFWRSGNVEMVCNKFRIPLFRSIDEIINFINKDDV